MRFGVTPVSGMLGSAVAFCCRPQRTPRTPLGISEPPLGVAFQTARVHSSFSPRTPARDRSPYLLVDDARFQIENRVLLLRLLQERLVPEPIRSPSVSLALCLSCEWMASG
jgi:hypothetical protein